MDSGSMLMVHVLFEKSAPKRCNVNIIWISYAAFYDVLESVYPPLLNSKGDRHIMMVSGGI